MEPKLGQNFLGHIGLEDDRPDEALAAFMHRQEFSDQKIEKLGVRITMVTILIPCLLGALLFFLYLDLKDKLVSENYTNTSEIKDITEDFQAKVNAMNVELAKVKHAFETSLPALTLTIKNLKTDFEKSSSNKVNKEDVEQKLTELQKSLTTLSNKQRETRKFTDQSSRKTISLLSETGDTLKAQIDSVDKQIKKDMAAGFKKEKGLRNALNNHLDETAQTLNNRLDEADQTLAILRKDVSLMRIETRNFQDTAVFLSDLEKQLKKLKADYDKKLQALKFSLEKSRLAAKNQGAIRQG